MKCPHCGAPLADGASHPTETLAAGAAPSVGAGSLYGGAPAGPGGSIPPGSILAGRYRIVGLLGRGAMGEVYRADDLKLDQQVALKFLPEQLSSDPDRLARLLNEVRIARQVSHPNVCRVYDVGEDEGRRFLTMEYIEGEDLAALLGAKNALPEAEALAIAQQLALGLAAAHEQGVLHRDLKPSNVMVDARGVARITDFGLAEVAQVIVGRRAREGTPLYMSPEQLAGAEVTQQSDIYALGLILFELFTGRRAFKGEGFEELLRAREQGPAAPSGVTPGLDAGVDRVIRHCLEPDPARRPRSAGDVAQALPGGKPLAAALAAAQQRADRILAFQSELSELRRSGVLRLEESDLSTLAKYHEGVLRDLVRHFDVDVTERGKQLSLGMRVVSLIGALSLAASVFYFFFRIWGLITLPVQVGVLVAAPLAALAATAAIARRERSGYFTLMAALFALTALVLDTSVLSTVLGVAPSPVGLLLWGLFALVLAYGYGLRLLLIAGVLSVACFVAALIPHWTGEYWPFFLMRPEGLLPSGVLALAGCERFGRGRTGFPFVFRVLGLLGVLAPVLMLGRMGRLSYLPFEPESIATGYQLLGFALGAAAVWLGIGRRLKEVIYGGGAFVVTMMYLKFADWWWNWMPKYLFFLIVTLTAIGVLWILTRLRASLAVLEAEERP